LQLHIRFAAQVSREPLGISRRSALLVDFPAMAYCVYNDSVFTAEDFEDDAVWAFSQLVETTQFAFECMQASGVKVLGEPSNSIGDSSCDRRVEFLQIFDGGFQNADGMQGLQAKTFANCGELIATISFGNGFALADQAFPEWRLQH
jgi:hypothetical protein